MNATQTKTYPEERRLATVLFADIQGFTALADRLDFEEVSDLVKEVWLRLDQVIEAHGGHIDKHIGDAVMALWGAPHSREDDAERAVTAALAMQASLASYVKKSPRQGASELKIRIGINTGLVMTGYVGVHNEYTVMGDTVNVAARFEQTAEPETVVISETTYRMIRGAFQVRQIPPLAVRGKPEPVPVFLVEAGLDQPSTLRYRGASSLITKMVGRTAELEQLEAINTRVKTEGQPILALVTGEAGLGKSRLLMEFASHLDVSQPNLILMSARGLAQASQVPFYLWKSLWQNRFGLSDNDPPEVARQKFPQGIRRLWGQQLGQIAVVEVIHLIGDLIGMDWPGSPYLEARNGPPQARLQRAFELNYELFRRVCERGQLVLLLDDLQWADKRSLDLVTFLLQPRPDSIPLLILAGARPQFLNQKPQEMTSLEVISLDPLAMNADLVSEAYPNLSALPQTMLNDLANRAAGNPYFLEELVRSLMLSGLTEVSQPGANLRSRLPVTLQATLQARLDTLSTEARTVILLASVIGRVFWLDAVQMAAAQTVFTTNLLNHTAGGLKNMIQKGLEELTQAELAFPRSGSIFAGEKEYIFKHSLLRDVAYGLMPLKHRRSGHLAVANWLLGRTGPDFKVIVADHFERAGAYPQAIRYYGESAGHARSQGALEEARWLEARIQELKSK